MKKRYFQKERAGYSLLEAACYVGLLSFFSVVLYHFIAASMQVCASQRLTSLQQSTLWYTVDCMQQDIMSASPLSEDWLIESDAMHMRNQHTGETIIWKLEKNRNRLTRAQGNNSISSEYHSEKMFKAMTKTPMLERVKDMVITLEPRIAHWELIATEIARITIKVIMMNGIQYTQTIMLRNRTLIPELPVDTGKNHGRRVRLAKPYTHTRIKKARSIPIQRLRKHKK